MDVGEVGEVEVVLETPTHGAVPLVGFPAHDAEGRVVELGQDGGREHRGLVTHAGPHQASRLDRRVDR